MAVPSPWHQLAGTALDVPGHDPATCRTCAPTRTDAYRRGETAANDDRGPR